MTTMDGKLLLIGVLAQIEVANIDCFGKNIHEYSSSLTEAMKFHSQKYLIMAFIITNKTSCTGFARFIVVATPKASHCKWNRYKQKLTKGEYL